VIDYERLLQIAATTRSYIQTSHNQAQALRDIITSHDVVFGIFPAEKNDGWDLHVVKGRELLSDQTGDYHHTVLPFQTREQAARLEALVA
jgi:hypothetical protein